MMNRILFKALAEVLSVFVSATGVTGPAVSMAGDVAAGNESAYVAEETAAETEAPDDKQPVTAGTGTASAKTGNGTGTASARTGNGTGTASVRTGNGTGTASDKTNNMTGTGSNANTGNTAGTASAKTGNGTGTASDSKLSKGW